MISTTGMSVSSPTSYAEALAAEAAHLAAAMSMRHYIETRYGSTAAFRDAVRICSLQADDAADLAAFHAVLGQSILPHELVAIDDFVAALGPKNHDAAFQRAIGPYRYFALAMRAPEGDIIGAAGFAVFCHYQGAVTLHASYYALAPAFRRLGLGAWLREAAASTAVAYAAQARPAAIGPERAILHIIEANDIARMTLGERLLDQAMAMHPVARDAMWERAGFREIAGLRYRQRATPPIELALKAQWIEIGGSGQTAHYRGTRPPDWIAAADIQRHVACFDAVLMNYDESSRSLLQGHLLACPQQAGLLAWLDPAARLPVTSTRRAALDRQYWLALDARLQSRTDLPLDANMAALGRRFGDGPPPGTREPQGDA